MRKFLLPIIVVIAAVLYSSVVVVTEGTRGIMLRFNKVQRDAENKVWCMSQVCISNCL